jgi:hypothetical protein
MLFTSPSDELEKFTARYCKKKSIGSIPLGDLERWKKLTQKTEGRHIRQNMAPSRWSDSVESLQTALAIVSTYVPSSVQSNEDYQNVLVVLRQRLLREIKLRHEAKHGPLKLKPSTK